MIDYRDTIDGVSTAGLAGFFEGWPDPPDAATHLRLLAGSDHVVLAWDDTAVVGFITAHTDGVLSAYIPLLEVLPAYRGRGIGAELVRRMMARLESLYMVDLVCDEDVKPFYEKLDFRPLLAMGRRNYARQSGAETSKRRDAETSK